MKKEFDWWEYNVTSEIYLNTHRRDWWRACAVLAELVKDAKMLIDVGGGDGHTLWQILSVAQAKGAKFKKITFIEPSGTGLAHARRRLKQLLVPFVLQQGTIENLGLRLKKKYDVLYAGHVNYYFGRQSGGTYDQRAGLHSLALLPTLANMVLIMTAPKHSDYYKVVETNPFSPLVFAEAVEKFYRSRGYHVRTISAPMRFYVAHAHQSKEEAIILWRFFNDTEEPPTAAQLKRFLCRLKKTQDKQGYINFKDKVVVVSGRIRLRGFRGSQSL